MTIPVARTRHAALITSSAYLMISQVGTAAIGFLFWLLAARHFSEESVGLASATISAMALLGAVATLGMGTLLIREMPEHRGSEARLVVAALILSAGIGMLLSLVFSILAPVITIELAALREPALAIGLIIGTGLTAAGLNLDQAFVGLQRSDLTLARNIIAAGGRLLVIGVAVTVASLAVRDMLVWAWTIGLAISFTVPFLVRKRRTLRAAFPPAWGILAGYRRAAAQHHLLNLSVQAPGWLMPLITVGVLSAATNAQFYIAWMLVGLGSFIPVALTWSLYASASRDPSQLRSSGRLTLAISASAAMIIAAGLATFGEMLLTPFGGSYVRAADGPLPILSLTLVAVVVKAHFVTVHRVRKTLRAATTMLILGATLEVTGAIVGAQTGGLVGLSIGLVVAMAVEAFLMAPAVYQAIIRSPPRQSSAREVSS